MLKTGLNLRDIKVIPPTVNSDLRTAQWAILQGFIPDHVMVAVACTNIVLEMCNSWPRYFEINWRQLIGHRK